MSAGAGGGGGSGYGPAGSTSFLGKAATNGAVTVTYSSGWMDTRVPTDTDPTVIRRAGTVDTVDVFYLRNGQAMHSTSTDGEPLSAPVIIDDGHWTGRLAAVSSGPQRIDVFARGKEGALWTSRFDGMTWSRPTQLTAANKLKSQPAVASWGPERLDVFWRGQNDGLVQFWSDNGGSTWHTYQLGGVVHGTPSAVSWGPNRIDILYPQGGLGNDPGMRWKRWDPSQGGWLPEAPAFNDELIGLAQATSRQPGQLDAYYVARDGNLIRQQWNAGLGWQRSTAGHMPLPLTTAVSVADVLVGPLHAIAATRSPATGTLLLRRL